MYSENLADSVIKEPSRNLPPLAAVEKCLHLKCILKTKEEAKKFW